jgi:exo-1,4-beta-D-glucosaminidase
VEDALKRGGSNALAVEIFAPEKWDLGITWVDWNPTPPDKDMGIWREVFLSDSGDVSLRRPFVNAKLGSDYKSAALTVSALLNNTTDHPVKSTLRVDLAGAQLSQPVELTAKESKVVRFTPEQFPQLKLAQPHLWWPYQMGDPYLYNAKFRVDANGSESDSSNVDFGIREVTSELTPSGGRLFKVNGKNVLIRLPKPNPSPPLPWSINWPACATIPVFSCGSTAAITLLLPKLKTCTSASSRIWSGPIPPFPLPVNRSLPSQENPASR